MIVSLGLKENYKEIIAIFLRLILIFGHAQGLPLPSTTTDQSHIISNGQGQRTSYREKHKQNNIETTKISCSCYRAVLFLTDVSTECHQM